MGNTTATYQYTKPIGTLAYIYGYAAVTQQVIMANDVNTKAPFNKLYYSSGLANPSYTPFPVPDTDVLYATAWLDLTNTSVILRIPKNKHKMRWNALQLIDMYGNNFYNSSSKKNKKYVIVGPDYNYQKLKKKHKIIVSPTPNVYLISRTAVVNNDVASTLKFMRKLKVSVTYPGAKVLSVQPYDPNILATIDFYKVLLNLMKYNPPPITEITLFVIFKSIGLDICTPNLNNLNSDAIAGLGDAIFPARAQIIPFGSLYSDSTIQINNWIGDTRLGTYCYNYLKRAFVNYENPGANFSRDQFYLTTTKDITGALLDGSLHDYTIHFSKEALPKSGSLNGFWSITLYTFADNKLSFYPNTISRYAINSNNSDLIYNADGSLDIFIQNVPTTALLNWLPAPLNVFKLILRIYAPSKNQIYYPDNIPGVNILP